MQQYYQFSTKLILLILLLSPTPFVQSRPHGKASRSSPNMKIPHRVKRDFFPPGPGVDFDDSPHDLVSYVDYTSGSSDSDIFDMRRQETLFCNLCIWIQPNYAIQRGFGNLPTGIAETLHMVKLLSWIFRALDINLDTVPDSIALVVHQVLVQDFNLPITNSSTSNDATVDAASSGGSRSLKYSTKIGTVDPATLLPFLEVNLSPRFSKQKCCAILSFIYHDVPKVLSFTSLRGLCSSHNVAVITGLKYGGNIGLYDVFRATFHALAHLFGANHDKRFDGDCFDKKVYRYLNPFVMEPDHHLNVGVRPNSMRLSYCSKSQIAIFLSSNLLTCFTSKREQFCGNGILEEGEECDCGALWQCVKGDQCCGTQDGFSPCKFNKAIKSLKSGKCMRPTDW